MTTHAFTEERGPGAGDPMAVEERRTLRRSLTYALIAVALLSVLLLGALNYWQARTLITQAVEDVLIEQQALRAATVRSGLDQLRTQVSLMAADEAVVTGVEGFSAAYRELAAAPELLSADQESEVVAAYTELDAAIAEAGLDAPDLVPKSAAARYLLYHYIVQNPHPPGQRDALVASRTDDSSYGVVHASQHEDLLRLVASEAIADLLLVDDEGIVVYSASKKFDLGTDLVAGPYRDSAVARAVINRVPAVPVGEAVYVDFERYLPASAAPSLFAAAAVRSGAETIGTVVVEIRIAALDAIMTSGGRWEETGLGETGEAYVVGSDLRMRSNSRLWLEDPDTYLERLAEAGADPDLAPLITLFDSTVLLQPVDTRAVEAALDEEQFVGRSSNYLGVSTLTAASPLGADQLDWVVVTSVDTEEATAALGSYTRRMLLAAAILIPLVALIGVALAGRMTSPVTPIVDAAREVAGGDLNVELPDLGNNEFGDVARRLNVLTSDLRERKAALAAEERAISTLLLSALPARIVARLRSEERDLDDLLDTATVVAISVHGLLDEPGIDQDSAVELAVGLAEELDEIATELGVERVRSSSSEHVFAVGLATPHTAASLAARFAIRVAAAIHAFGEHAGVALTHHIGMCGGEVVAVVLGADQLTYGVMGGSMRSALALQTVAAADQILVCDDTAGELRPEWNLSPATGLVDLRGEPIAAHILESGQALDAAGAVQDASSARD